MGFVSCLEDIQERLDDVLYKTHQSLVRERILESSEKEHSQVYIRQLESIRQDIARIQKQIHSALEIVSQSDIDTASALAQEREWVKLLEKSKQWLQSQRDRETQSLSNYIEAVKKRVSQDLIRERSRRKEVEQLLKQEQSRRIKVERALQESKNTIQQLIQGRQEDV